MAPATALAQTPRQKLSSVSKLRPADEDSIRTLIQGSVARAGGRTAKQQEIERVLWGEHDISFPKEMDNPSRIYIKRSIGQVEMIKGLLSDEERIRFLATSPNVQAKDAAQRRESYHNALFPMLEQQGGDVRMKLRHNSLVYGYAVDRLTMLPSRLRPGKNGVPDPETYDGNDTAYLADRETALKAMGTSSGRLPYSWRAISVAPGHFFFEEDEEQQGLLALAIEVRTIRLATLLGNPRYRELDLKLWTHYDKMREKEGARCSDLFVQWITVEDRNWCSQFALPARDMGYGTADVWGDDRTLSLQSAFDGLYTGGELVSQYKNALGRLTYIFTPGLDSGDYDLAKRYRGVTHDSEHLEKAMNSLLSWRVTAAKAWLTPPIIEESDPPGPNTPPMLGPQNEDDAGQPEVFQLKRDGSTINKLTPGARLQFLQPVANPEILHVQTDVANHLNAGGIPESLLDATAGTSGYQLDTLIGVVKSRYKQYMTHIKRAHVQRVQLAELLARQHGDTTFVASEDGDSAKWISFDPKDEDHGPVVMECIFDLKRKETTLADIQAASAAVALGYAPARAMEEFLDEEDADAIVEERLVWDWMQSDPVKSFYTTKSVENAGLELDKAEAQKQGAVTPDMLAKTSGAFREALGMEAAPGTPAANALQAFQAGQQGTAPAAAPTAASPTPAAPPRRRGGRAPGQRVQPGGPKRTGGGY